MHIYLAGPMTGLPDHNFPAFNRAEELLKSYGHTVFNPARNGAEKAYRDLLAIDLEVICKEADAIALLPGWHNSPGAQAEFAVAKAIGIGIIWLQDEVQGLEHAA